MFEESEQDLEQEQLQEEALRKRKQELDDLAVVMDTAAGKRLIWRLLESAGVFRQSFVPDSPHSTSFNEGRRSHGNQLLSDIHADDRCSRAYFEIIKDNQEG